MFILCTVNDNCNEYEYDKVYAHVDKNTGCSQTREPLVTDIEHPLPRRTPQTVIPRVQKTAQAKFNFTKIVHHQTRSCIIYLLHECSSRQSSVRGLKRCHTKTTILTYNKGKNTLHVQKSVEVL